MPGLPAHGAANLGGSRLFRGQGRLKVGMPAPQDPSWLSLFMRDSISGTTRGSRADEGVRPTLVRYLPFLWHTQVRLAFVVGEEVASAAPWTSVCGQDL